tara:strand:- start:1831 stop:2625 length:795 start_codon:yes stop_codon:yes gene_type:complete
MSNIIIDPYRFGIDCSSNVISCTIKPLSFDGTNDELVLADHDDFSFDAVNTAANINVAHSVCVYLNRDSLFNNEGIYRKANSLNNMEYRVFFLGNDLYCDTYDTHVNTYSRRIFYNISSSLMAVNTWFQLCVAFGTEGREASAWVNGISLGAGSGGGSGSGDIENLTMEFSIGGAMSNAGLNFYEGLLTQFMLWKDHKLTQDEVDYLYSSGTALRNPTIDCGDYQISNKLKLWVKDETGNDYSGNSHHMTLTGGLTHAGSSSPC